MSELEQDIHTGVVTGIEDDYTTVELTTPDGVLYDRAFETEFLRQSGVSRAGDGVRLTFSQTVEDGGGVVTMRVRGIPRDLDKARAELKATIGEADLGKIRDAFGSYME